MPDITMCLNERCPIKSTCYRYTAHPNEYWQSYSNFEYDPEFGCDDFISNDFMEVKSRRNNPRSLFRTLTMEI